MEPSSLAEKNDRELLVLARAGNKLAFGELIERYRTAAIRLATRMVSDEQVAQDIVQESMLQAYLSLDKLKNEDAFRSWLFGIVLNLCRNYFRGQKTRFFTLESLDGGRRFDTLAFSGDQPDPQEVLEARELHRLILGAIDELSEENRQATFLFYYQQLSIQEIAAILGMSVSAIKVRLHRSRKLMQQRLMSLAQEEYPLIPELDRRHGMRKARIIDVIKQEKGTGYIVVMQDEAGGRILPIWIGSFEGHSIALGMQQFSFPRPMTFQFIENMLEAIGVVLEEVRIEALKGDTFYAVVKLRRGKQIKELDARPSDALALAVLTGSQIYVSEDVLKAAGIDFVAPGGVLKKPGQGVDEIVREMEEGWKSMMASSPSEEERQKSRQRLLAYLAGES